VYKTARRQKLFDIPKQSNHLFTASKNARHGCFSKTFSPPPVVSPEFSPGWQEAHRLSFCLH